MQNSTEEIKKGRVHLFKNIYLEKLSYGQKLLKKIEAHVDENGKQVKESFQLIGHPHENYIYKSAIKHFEEEFMLDEEVVEFKNMVEKMENLKIEIEEMLTKGMK